MKILSLTEHNFGGEFKATQSLLRAVEENGVTVEYQTLAPLTKTGLLSYFWWILQSVAYSSRLAWRQRDCDIVYTTTYTALLGAELVRALTKQRVCFHYHWSRIPASTEEGLSAFRSTTQKIKHAVVVFLHNIAWSNADLFIAPSAQVFHSLSQNFKQLGKKAVIVPNGVDTQNFIPVSEEEQTVLRKQYHIPHRAFVCLVISRINAEKRILETLQFIRDLQDNCRKQVLLLMALPSEGNDDEYLQRVQKALNQIELPHYVFVDHPKIQELYQISDCFLSHSNTEVFPLVLLEAAAVGIPYFASENGEVERFLEEIDPGLILPRSEIGAVRQVLANTHKRKLSESLRRFALAHTWQASAIQLLDCLKLHEP